MADLIITPSTGKIEFIYQGGPDGQQGQTSRVESIIVDTTDGVVFSGRISASSVTAPLNVINVTAGSSNVNYPFIFASSGETGAKSLLMDSAGGTYNPSTNTATIDVSGNSATTTLASNSSQLNGQAASYYTDINARLGYTPVNKAGDTVTGNLIINGNFSVNGSFTAFSASNVYISSSQLYIEDNILTLNAFSPYLRYAGVEMYDSGSGTLSSLLWDGEADYFFLTGSSVNGKIITGPDGQTNLTANFVAKATAGNKLGNSIIYDNGTSVGIGTTTVNQKVSIYPGTTGGISLQDIDSETRSYFFIDNTNGIFSTGIRTANYYLDFDSSGGAQNAIRFYTGTSTIGTGTERMRIISTGNVGIGTNTPGARLEISSSTAASLLNVKGAGGNNLLFVSGSGAVGIGTSIPTQILDVRGNIKLGADSAGNYIYYVKDNEGTIIRTTRSDVTQEGLFRSDGWGNFTVNKSIGIGYSLGSGFDSNAIGNGNLYVAGKVGIGTSSSVSKLHIEQIQNAESLITLRNNRQDFGNVPVFGISAQNGTTDVSKISFYRGAGGDSGYLTFSTKVDNASSLTEKVRIDGAGNVGIGIAVPTAPLHVVGVISGSSFTGAGTGLTGTAAGLSIGGTAATATTASYSLNTTLTTAATYPITSSWATNAVTALNGGVTSISAGTGIGTSASTGAVTITNSSPNATHTGDVTGATALTIANDAVTTVKILNANVTNAKLANSSVTIGSTAVSLGGTVTTFAGLASVTSTAFVGALTGNVTGNVTGTAGSETFTTVTGRGASTTTQISVGTTAGGSMYTGIKSGAGYSDAVSGATFKSITDHPTGGSYAFAAYFNGAPGTGTNSFFVAADGTGYFKGYVGIGTTAPQYPLDISGSNIRSFSTAGGAEPGFIADYPSSNGYGGFFIHVNNTRRWRIGSVGDTNVQPALNFWQEGTGSRMIITNTGNVGIGSTSPANRFEVVGSTFNRASFIATANVQTGIQIQRTGGVSNTNWEIYSPASSGDLRINNVADYVTFKSGSGWVGIGTTSPADKLQVGAGHISIDAGYKYYMDANVGAVAIRKDGASMVFTVGATDKVYINESGNVGIGTSNATAKLESYYSSNAITFNYLATNLNNNSPIPVYGFDVTNGVGETRSIKAGIGYERHETNGRGTMHFYNDSTNDTQSLSGNRSSAGDIKMSINNVGNVGIGTTSPATLLHVDTAGADARIRVSAGTNTVQGGMIANTNGLVYAGSITNHGFSLRTNDTDRVRIQTDGNVGIGITSPAYKLDINSANDDALRIRNGAGGANNGLALCIGSGSPWLDITEGVEFRIKGNTYANLGTWNSGNNTKLLINSSGNVGIGTTSPATKLEVYGVVRVSESSSGGILQLTAGASSIDIASTFYGGSRRPITFTMDSEKVRIAADGNVGVGTTAPGKKLDVEGVVRTRGATGTGGFEIGAATTGTAKWRIEWDSASDSLDFNWVG